MLEVTRKPVNFGYCLTATGLYIQYHQNYSWSSRRKSLPQLKYHLKFEILKASRRFHWPQKASLRCACGSAAPEGWQWPPWRSIPGIRRAFRRGGCGGGPGEKSEQIWDSSHQRCATCHAMVVAQVVAHQTTDLDVLRSIPTGSWAFFYSSLSYV